MVIKESSQLKKSERLSTWKVDIDSRLSVVFAIVSAILILLHETASNVFGWLSVLCITSRLLITCQIASNWRMIPLFITVVISTVLMICNLAGPSVQLLSLRGKIAIVVVLLVVSAVTALILYLFPVPSAGVLVGPYQRVGTSTIVIDDNKGGSLNVQIWFPLASDAPAGPKAALWTSGCPTHRALESRLLLNGMSRTYGLPSLILQHLQQARTNSEWFANCDHVIKDCGAHSLPVAIYSHGMYGWRQVHHTTCETLANHGYVVFAIDHAPDCMVSRPHGSLQSSKYFDYLVPKGYSGPEERTFYHEGINRRSDNIVALIDFLHSEQISTQLPHFKRVMNTAKINLWGHSFGAGSVATVCSRDNRITSAVLLDSWMYPVPDADRRVGSCSANILLISAEKWKFGKVLYMYYRLLLV
jgi:hypothetical protein